MRNLIKGKVIVFEGIDGCGKDTQITLLTEYLDSIGESYCVINSLSDNILGRYIRDKIKKGNNNNIYQLACLFLAELYNHSSFINNHNIHYNYFLINRWIYSTICYNSKTQEDIDSIMYMGRELVTPDTVIRLKIDIDTAVKRIEKRNTDLELFETKDYLTHVDKQYDNIDKLFKHNIITIDANPTEPLFYHRPGYDVFLKIKNEIFK